MSGDSPRTWLFGSRFTPQAPGDRGRMHWIWFIIVGALVGALGRLFPPGRDPMGWLLTIAIGIVSMIIAAAISGGWLAFVIGVIVAVILVALVGRWSGNRGRGVTAGI